MEPRKRIAAGAPAKAAVALALLASLLGCAACAAPQERDGGQAGRPQAADSPAASGSQEAGSPEAALGGIETDWLDPGQRGGLEAALAGYFGEGAQLRVVGGPATVGQATVTYVEDLASGGFYEARLYPDDKWAVGPLRQLVDGVNSQGPDGPDEGTDATGALTSREAAFDAGNCVSASDASALADLLGGDCASALVGSLASALADRGVAGVTERDVMVERDVARADGALSFKALAVSGNERIVLACTWDGAAGELAAEALG